METLMNQRNIKRVIHIINALSILGFIVFSIYGIQTGLFLSEKALEEFLAQFGLWAPIIFILIQGIQVVFPVIPGSLGCLAGVLIFGPTKGFIYNYIGICAGSIAAFLIAKVYGTPLIEILFSARLLKKYQRWLGNSKFDLWFAIAIFLPVAPDDFLCYLAGTTKMTLTKFTVIILLGKPLAIAAYSLGLNFIFQHLLVWLPK